MMASLSTQRMLFLSLATLMAAVSLVGAFLLGYQSENDDFSLGSLGPWSGQDIKMKTMISSSNATEVLAISGSIVVRTSDSRGLTRENKRNHQHSLLTRSTISAMVPASVSMNVTNASGVLLNSSVTSDALQGSEMSNTSFSMKGRNTYHNGAAGTTNAQGSGRDSSTSGRVRVFIAVKTTVNGMYQERIAQLRRTWLRDALAEPSVDIRFFVGRVDEVGLNKSSQVSGAIANMSNDDLSSLVVKIGTCSDTKKLCKTFETLQYFQNNVLQPGASTEETTLGNNSNIDISPPPSFFCNFDDDAYVIIPNLLKSLYEYQQKSPWHGRNLYIGRQSMKNGFKHPLYKNLIHFHTGAAWCLSSDLVQRGEEHFPAMKRTRLADDIAVGYMVKERLNVKLVEDSRFNSHLNHQEKEVPADQVSQQITFGYSNKEHSWGDLRFPDIPFLFSKEEDPLRFRSLRCLLLRERSNEDRSALQEYNSECNIRENLENSEIS